MSKQQKLWTPDDGHVWTEHTPGDPMPCDGEVVVCVLLRFRRELRQPPLNPKHHAKTWGWGRQDDHAAEIVAWRPA